MPEEPNQEQEQLDPAKQKEDKSRTTFLQGKVVRDKKLLTGVMILLAVLVVVAVIATGKQWVQNLKMPFLIPESERFTNLNSSAENDFEDLITLQLKDTDLDGLSDYDELYLYNSSPYLEDSDSDGFNDFEEVQSGDDPNCPKGATCGIQGAPAELMAGTEIPWEDLLNLSPEQLRILLIEQGLSAEEVNKLSDEELKKAFQESLTTIQQPDSLSDLLSQEEFSLSPEQIREMLVQQGIAEKDIAQFSDAQLNEMWQEFLKQAEDAGSSLP